MGREFTDPARTLDDLAALARLARRSRLACGQASPVESGRSLATRTGWWCPSCARWPSPGPYSESASLARSVTSTTPQSLTSSGTCSRELPNFLACSPITTFGSRPASGESRPIRDEDDPVRVRTDPTHLEALARTADHYRSVRLHRLRFPDGAVGRTAPALESTLLIDFTETPPWRAVRAATDRTSARRLFTESKHELTAPNRMSPRSPRRSPASSGAKANAISAPAPALAPVDERAD